MTAYSFSSGNPGIFSARTEASDADFLYTTERYEVGKTVFGGEEAGIDSGTYQHAAVGIDAHSLVGCGAEMVEEVRYAGIQLREALAVGGGQVHVVVEPRLQRGVFYLVVAQHFPVAHVHLF